MSERIVEGVRLSSPDKILYPDQGITKLELAEYYQLVAKWMLPHVVNRALVLVRVGRRRGVPAEVRVRAGDEAIDRLVARRGHHPVEMGAVNDHL